MVHTSAKYAQSPAIAQRRTRVCSYHAEPRAHVVLSTRECGGARMPASKILRTPHACERTHVFVRVNVVCDRKCVAVGGLQRTFCFFPARSCEGTSANFAIETSNSTSSRLGLLFRMPTTFPGSCKADGSEKQLASVVTKKHSY
jgi:hypothetical protein